MENTVLSEMLGVFEGVANWLTRAVQNIIPMFYAEETGLTFIGILAIASLAISVAFLLINVIRSYLTFA